MFLVSTTKQVTPEAAKMLKLTFDQKMRLMDLDDLRKARALTPELRAEYSALVVAWKSESDRRVRRVRPTH